MVKYRVDFSCAIFTYAGREEWNERHRAHPSVAKATMIDGRHTPLRLQKANMLRGMVHEMVVIGPKDPLFQFRGNPSSKRTKL